MTRVRVLVLQHGLGALDYAVPDGLGLAPGDIVEVPLGPRTIVGVVWEAERWPAREVPDAKLRAVTARFAVPIEEGQRILRTLRGRVTGLAWPTYVLDIPGGHGKVPIGPGYLDADTVLDPAGVRRNLAGVSGTG